MRIHVSVIEDDDKLRASLCGVLDSEPGFKCLSDHATGEDALARLPVQKSPVVLLDLGLPKMAGIECLKGLRAKNPDLRVLVFTQYAREELILDALKAGADGYLLKKFGLAQLFESIRIVQEGGSQFTPSIARRIAEFFRETPGAGAAAAGKEYHLTPRHRELLDLAKRGQTSKEIAAAVILSVHTVNTHFRNILRALEARSRTEAVAKYTEMTHCHSSKFHGGPRNG